VAARNYTSVDHVGVEHAVLLQIVGDGVLREERGLHCDFSADPLALGMRSIGNMFARPARSKLRPEPGPLDRVELLELFPGLVANSAGDVDAESDGGHGDILTTRGEGRL
jgi:hypothetical protein